MRVGSRNANYDTGATSYNIDLGEISNGASADFGIFIRGTTGYTLTMHTASGGFLTSSNSEDKIQYTIIVDGKEYYLVKWVGYSEDEATWEPHSHLVGCSEILLKFKMSKLNKNDLDDMTESLQRENDFEDCTKMPP